MKKLFLTIDDSPSVYTVELADFLTEKNIPALFFARGDNIEKYPGILERLIERGFLVGSHAYSHRRSGKLSVPEFAEEIEKTDALLNAAFKNAGVKRGKKYFRFPYLDRGCGSFPTSPDGLSPGKIEALTGIMLDLVPEVVPPSAAGIAHQKKLQEVLKNAGYEAVSSVAFYENVWYMDTPMRDEIDIGLSLVAGDWKLLPRHSARYGKTADDLCLDMLPKIKGDGAEILCMHDYGDTPDAPVNFQKIITFLSEKTGFLGIE